MSVDAITPRAVRIALRQLSSDRTPADGPLTDLALVTRVLERQGSPISRSSRQWALGHVLGEAVEVELARLRESAGRSATGPASAERGTAAVGRGIMRTAPAATADALDRLRLDFRADDPALEGCSTVYHLYLRPDLGLSTTRMAALVPGRHPRTVQRRLGLGLELVARRLRVLETAAAAERAHDELRRRLPTPAGGQLFGAERITAPLRTRWSGTGRPAILVLSGPAGSGKSTAAAAFVRRLLDDDPAVRVAWLDARDRRPGPAADPAPATDGRQALPSLREESPAGSWSTAVAVTDRHAGPSGRPEARADPAGHAASSDLARRTTNMDRVNRTTYRGPAGHASSSARAVLTAFRTLGPRAGTLVVIDGVDDPREMWAVARAIGRAVGHPGERGCVWPRVVITSRLGWGAFEAAETIPMPVLEPTAALALLRHECRRRALHGVAAASDRALGALVSAAAGHPAALLLAAGELRAAPIDDVAERLRRGTGRAGELYERMWARAWHGAPPSVRQAVDGVAALERAGRGADPAAIAAAMGMTGDEAEAAVCAALDLGLLGAAGDAGDATGALDTGAAPSAGASQDGGFGLRTPAFLGIWRAGLPG